MDKFVEISNVRNKYFNASQSLNETNLKLLHNLECEKAEAELPYKWTELHAEAEIIRAEMVQVVETLSDEAAVIVPDLFPVWGSNRAYKAGERFVYNGNLYRCKVDNPVNPTWTPDVAYDYYEPIAKALEDGSINNPIVAVEGMRYKKDLYYKEDEVIYLCIRDDSEDNIGTVLHYLPSALDGVYFEKQV